MVIRAGLPRPRQPALSQCICPKQNNPGFDVGFLGLRQRWSDAPASEGWCSGVLRTHPSRMPPPSGAKLLGRPRSVSSKWTLWLKSGVIICHLLARLRHLCASLRGRGDLSIMQADGIAETSLWRRRGWACTLPRTAAAAPDKCRHKVYLDKDLDAKASLRPDALLKHHPQRRLS